MVARCEGLSDVGCQFKDFASDDSTVIFNKTDGAVASPPNHKVVFETDEIRVVRAAATCKCACCTVCVQMRAVLETLPPLRPASFANPRAPPPPPRA